MTARSSLRTGYASGKEPAKVKMLSPTWKHHWRTLYQCLIVLVIYTTACGEWNCAMNPIAAVGGYIIL